MCSLNLSRSSIALPASAEGYAQMLLWTRAHGRLVAFGVEGTGSYGSGLALYLRRQGVKVSEVSRPPRRENTRRARLLSGQATTVPKAPDKLRAELKGLTDVRLITACAG